jgi:hypothetical protein
MGRAIGGVTEMSSIRWCFHGGVLQYGCGGIVVSTMTCGMVAVWMNQQEGRVARDEGPTAGTCCGVSGTLPSDDRRYGGTRVTRLG